MTIAGMMSGKSVMNSTTGRRYGILSRIQYAVGTTRSSQALALGGSIGLWRRWTADVRYLQGRKGLYKKIGGGAEGKTRTLQMTVEYQF